MPKPTDPSSSVEPIEQEQIENVHPDIDPIPQAQGDEIDEIDGDLAPEGLDSVSEFEAFDRNASANANKLIVEEPFVDWTPKRTGTYSYLIIVGMLIMIFMVTIVGLNTVMGDILQMPGFTFGLQSFLEEDAPPAQANPPPPIPEVQVRGRPLQKTDQEALQSSISQAQKQKIQEEVDRYDAVGTLIRKGWVAIRNEDWWLAEGMFQKVLQIEPSNGESLYGLGYIQERYFWGKKDPIGRKQHHGDAIKNYCLALQTSALDADTKNELETRLQQLHTFGHSSQSELCPDK